MTAQSFAYLACSIMTLYILYLRLKKLVFIANDLVEIVNTGNFSYGRLASFASLLSDLAAFLVLWVGASQLFGQMVRDCSNQTDSAVGTVGSYFELAVSILGLVTIVNAIPSIVFELAHYLT